MLKLGILCSGNLGLSALHKIIKDYTTAFVLTDLKSQGIITLANKNNIPCFIGNPREGKGYNFIKNIEVDVIVSINYLFLIKSDIINHPKKMTFNIHGSLLPKYRGRTPHVWAIINGETKAGITAHMIDKGCDTGNIIRQIEIPIENNDTGADMLKKYEKLYFPLIQNTLDAVKNDTLVLTVQDESKATYFGKRTPDDGEIDWEQGRESIRNWIRAQAHPYPGAFTYMNHRKIIIDKSSISNEKVSNNQQNGEIISANGVTIIKTKDGALRLDLIRTENCIFTKGQILGNENRK